MFLMLCSSIASYLLLSLRETIYLSLSKKASDFYIYWAYLPSAIFRRCSIVDKRLRFSASFLHSTSYSLLCRLVVSDLADYNSSI